MSALQAEAIAITECLAALDAGNKPKAEVWLRLADEAHLSQDWT